MNNSIDLTEIHRILYPIMEYIFFSSTHETLSRIEHMLGHRTSLKFKKAEITQNIFSDHNGKKLETRMEVTRDREEEKRSCCFVGVEFQSKIKSSGDLFQTNAYTYT